MEEAWIAIEVKNQKATLGDVHQLEDYVSALNQRKARCAAAALLAPDFRSNCVPTDESVTLFEIPSFKPAEPTELDALTRSLSLRPRQ
jgi:RecB family endonuclease NucS